MGIALTSRYQPRHSSPCHATRRLNQHLQVEAVGKAPFNLAYSVPREREHFFFARYRNGGHESCPR
jgi:hypothetical protein